MRALHMWRVKIQKGKTYPYHNFPIRYPEFIVKRLQHGVNAANKEVGGGTQLEKNQKGPDKEGFERK